LKSNKNWDLLPLTVRNNKITVFVRQWRYRW